MKLKYSSLLVMTFILALVIAALPAVPAQASDDDEIHGTIESLPSGGLIGDWVVSGTIVHVTAGTRIKQEHGQAVVGAPVEVKGERLGDGTFDADEIEVEHSGGGGGGGSDDNGNDDEIHGTIQSLPATGFIGDWVVSGRTVHVSASTTIEQEHGSVAVGAFVEVHGVPQQDGSLNATRIEVNPTGGGGNGGGGSDDNGNDDEIHGTIQSLPASGFIGDWVVSGRTVHVSASTSIEQEHGRVAVGAFVEVHGVPLQDGSLDAIRIEVNPTHGGGGMTGGEATFFGTVETLPADGLIGTWVVGGRVVRVSEATRIEREHGVAPQVGSYVKVEGSEMGDGSVDAREVEVKTGGSSNPAPSSTASGFIRLTAKASSVPNTGLVGEWIVGGRTVFVDATTGIKQKKAAAQSGVQVEVTGNQREDGSIDAAQVTVKAAKGSSKSSVKFYGTVESRPASGFAGEWVVNGQAVVVDSSTFVDQERGAAVIGAYVEVEAKAAGSSALVASKIEVKSSSTSAGSSGYIEFKGEVENLPANGVAGDWIVSGRTVHVPSGVRLREKKGRLRTGARVEVEGNQRSDGSVDAIKIDVKN